MRNESIVKERQQPLFESYTKDPESAKIIDSAVVEGKNFDDPLHTSVSINGELKVDFPIGVHRAVGGHHDYPNSGDMLCASLASCFETVFRMVADRMQVPIIETRVEATAHVDVRGTLMMDKSVPVEFQKMGLHITVKVPDGVDESTVRKLVGASEKSCIVLQTLKKGIPVDLEVEVI